MDLCLGRRRALSQHLTEEIRSLSSHLEESLKLDFVHSLDGPIYQAAGTTRLEKIEMIPGPVRSRKKNRLLDYQKLEESLIIRARGNKYTSAGIATFLPSKSGSQIEIRIEHEKGAAFLLTIPVRYKRLGCLSTGEPAVKSTTILWFIKECPIALNTV